MGLPDSGTRTQFGDGAAIREADPNKPAVEGISPFAIWRLGRLFAKGGKKYGDFRNWEKGMPFTRYTGAIIRHAFQYLARDTTEDHLAAIMWNAQCLMHHEEVGDAEKWDDRPRWGRDHLNVNDYEPIEVDPPKVDEREPVLKDEDPLEVHKANIIAAHRHDAEVTVTWGDPERVDRGIISQLALNGEAPYFVVQPGSSRQHIGVTIPVKAVKEIEARFGD